MADKHEKLPLPPRPYALPVRRFGSDTPDRHLRRDGFVEVAPAGLQSPVPLLAPPARAVVTPADSRKPQKRRKQAPPKVTLDELHKTIREIEGRAPGLMLRLPKPLLARLDAACGLVPRQIFIRRLLDEHLAK